MSRINILTLFAAILAGAVPALGTPPGDAVPLAGEQLGGTILTVAPRIGYEAAVLRVSGPAGYALTERFRGGAALTVDLAVETERQPVTDRELQNAPRDREAPTLPDGRYNYEVVFFDVTGESQVHSGLFFVEGGSLVSREAKRAELAGVREDLGRLRREHPASGPGTEVTGAVTSPETYSTADWIAITDGPNDGITYLSLDSDSPSTDFYWLAANVMGDLELHEDTDFSFPGTPRMTLERGGQVGIGTTAPQRALHVVDTSAFVQLRLDDGSGDVFDFNLGPVGLWFLDEDSQSVFRVNHSASTSALVVDGAGVGVGTDGPEADLHVFGADGTTKILVEETAGPPTARELFKLQNNGGPFFIFSDSSLSQSWSFAMGATGDFIQSHQQSPGVELRLSQSGNLTIRGVLTEGSSREIKEGIAPVDGRDVLARVAELPIATWSYRADEEGARHLGPMAEDFRQAFGLGASATGIASLDTAGVALAAIKGLHSEDAEKELRIAELEQRNAELADRLRAVEEALQALGAP